MNDLDAVAFDEAGVRPVGAAHDLAVEFDGQALRRKRKMIDETVEGQMIRHFAHLSVDRDSQGSHPLTLLDDAT
jgi:hypothetical protein